MACDVIFIVPICIVVYVYTMDCPILFNTRMHSVNCESLQALRIAVVSK